MTDNNMNETMAELVRRIYQWGFGAPGTMPVGKTAKKCELKLIAYFDTAEQCEEFVSGVAEHLDHLDMDGLHTAWLEESDTVDDVCPCSDCSDCSDCEGEA